jgi:diguanylate cyclase (GGDEF)-like protein
MRTSLGLTILVMGLIGMVLAIATGEAYRHLALENQRAAFVELAKLKVDDIIQEVTDDTVQLGVTAQGAPGFKQAFRKGEIEDVVRQLDQHFHRAFVTLGRVNLAKIYALDKNYQLITSSSEGHPDFSSSEPACQGLLASSTHRQGAERLKPVSRLCQTNGNPYIAVLTPIGGLRLQGYLLLIVNPIGNIAAAEQGLGTPLRISLPAKHQQIAQSESWPAKIEDNILLASYLMQTVNGDPYLQLTFASDISELLQRLAKTRNIIFTIAIVVIILTALLVLVTFNRTALLPLRKLAQHLRLVQQDKSLLGQPVKVHGNAEVAELAADFNNMSSELHALYKALENMAFTDTLTGMANRALFYNRLEQAVLNMQRYKSQFAVFMMDLDRFKNINDTLGHHFGDQILQEVAQRLQGVLRKSDTVARLGGDEFAALLPSVEYEDGITIVAEKIVEVMSKPIVIEGHSLTIGVSIGVVHCPRDGDNPNLLMRRADVAMYKAKRQSKGYLFYEQSMDSHSLFELTMEAELRKAVEAGSFELHYQPKIDIQSKRILGVEALIRWIHPEHGFIAPDQFIPLAEQSGLIHPITEWVLNTALAQANKWQRQGMDIGVAVNLSAYSLNDATLLDMVATALAVSDVPARLLTLELTESAIMSDASCALDILTRLDAMGVRLSVDDFGTGYSSLAYLKRLPVDEIKIDKSFVMDMMEDANDAVIVRSTIDLAHNMGMKVVAEGIENSEIWDRLSELHCNMGQGFYMCRPCQAKDLAQWLEESPWGLGGGKAAN